ncbi:MAG: hypothetical protein RMJ43_02925 [Chloroherpetonaceae bacterium]|nr:hypothetical protein [Chthonomonadaceae bacterium]MDW8206762.1 hypothetical protein [Chloroherpetonaceae bacterium]
MYDRLDLATLKGLLADAPAVCVSLFMPMHRTEENAQNISHIKNLTREAQRQLTAQGMSSTEAQAFLEPVHRLVEETDLWRHPGDGLAIFCSSEGCQRFRVPLPLEEKAIVAPRYHVLPLLPLMQGDGRFYLLALSQNAVRLWRGDREGLTELPLGEDVPRSLADALRFDEADELYFDRNNAYGAGMPFHGHSEFKDSHKEKLGRFFNLVDKGVCRVIGNDRAPLVLAGVDYLLPIYRSNAEYAPILRESVIGNPEALRPQELHARAWPLVAPVFEMGLQQDIARFREAAGTTRRTCTDTANVVRAAAFGQVETLFVAARAQQPGVFDPETHTVHLHDTWTPGDEDLLNAAAVFTLQQGGTAYLLPSAAMPVEGPLAALLRYDMAGSRIPTESR